MINNNYFGINLYCIFIENIKNILFNRHFLI